MVVSGFVVGGQLARQVADGDELPARGVGLNG